MNPQPDPRPASDRAAPPARPPAARASPAALPAARAPTDRPAGRSRLRTLAAVALLAIPVALLAAPGDGATTRTLAINTASAHPLVPFQAFDGDPPKVFDFNGDGTLEIVAQNDNQWVYVFDSRSGALLAEVTTTFPSGWGARSINGPEAAILTSGGTPHLIVANSAAYITSFRFDPGSTRTHIVLVKEWERRLNDCFSNPGMDAKPVFADLDRDGTMEILGATEESGLYALRADGSLMWKNCLGGGNAEPGVGDLNQDGYPDVVFGDDGGIVSALNGRTGSFMWRYYILSHFALHSASMPVGVAVGQLDGIGGPDVVVGARDSHDALNWSNDHALLLALDSGGRLLWARQDTDGGAPLTYTHAIISDADKNGEAEVYWADWNTIGHKPPYTEADSWKVTGPAHFYRYDAKGNMVWRQTLPTWWNNKDIPLADVDGDGVQEMLANAPNTNGHDGIWYLDTRTGAKETFVDVYPWKVQRAPVVADLYGDGMMEWVLPASPAASGAGTGGAILVFSTGARYSSAWPHLPYPTAGSAMPPPPPPPNGGTFSATFTVKAANEWWQELYVDAPGHTITEAQVRVNGDAWYAMSKSSWGAWTASVHAVKGAQVEFLVTDSAGATSQSQAFTWLDGTTSRPSTGGSPPPPPSTTFTATFTPSPNNNNWWVETSVKASAPVASVDAQVNGGSWTNLPKTNWGTYAKSFHVDSGAKVVFRATSGSGATATSGVYTWA